MNESDIVCAYAKKKKKRHEKKKKRMKKIQIESGINI
jgi:hypothetical protein